jgi:hypothetical protein
VITVTVPSELAADFVARANLSAVLNRLASLDRRICNSIRSQRIRDTYIYTVRFFVNSRRFDLVVDALDVDWDSVESVATEVALTYAPSR